MTHVRYEERDHVVMTLTDGKIELLKRRDLKDVTDALFLAAWVLLADDNRGNTCTCRLPECAQRRAAVAQLRELAK